MTMLALTKSASVFARAKEIIPGGVNSPVRSFRSVGGTPPFITGGRGSRVYDADGNSYIDYVLSYGPLLLGHTHPVVTKAVQDAAAKGTSFGAPTPAEVTLAELVCRLVPSMEMVRMVNSGTEATMSALRLARAYTGREYIIKFIGCYHGHSDALLVQAGSGAATFGVPDSPGVTKGTAETTISVPFNDLPALEKVFAERGSQIAAVIMEPTPGNMGLVLPHEGYLAAVRALTKKYGTLLIIDEVMSGFRAAQGGSQSIYRIDPDITCLGKVIGGGLPVAAYGGKREIMNWVSPAGPMYQAGTLSGNPLAMAAGIAALTYMQEQDVCATLTQRAKALTDGLKQAAKEVGVPVCIHHLGSMFTVFFTDKEVENYEDAAACDQDAFRVYFHSMLEQGIYLPPSQFETNFISLAHSEEDFAATVATAKVAFAKVAAAKK
ncbi:MAG: glutamate-1-semialdehyde 2,1-aminomutase [Succiniclasticum sp.]|nr:glutamate-1-semialdehyde 2,1-aminomutase [Succiniclasticum sp.]